MVEIYNLQDINGNVLKLEKGQHLNLVFSKGDSMLASNILGKVISDFRKDNNAVHLSANGAPQVTISGVWKSYSIYDEINLEGAIADVCNRPKSLLALTTDRTLDSLSEKTKDYLRKIENNSADADTTIIVASIGTLWAGEQGSHYKTFLVIRDITKLYKIVPVEDVDKYSGRVVIYCKETAEVFSVKGFDMTC